MSVRPRAIAGLIVVLVAACAGSGEADPEPDLTDSPTAALTPDPWPASFEVGLCAAMEAFPEVAEHMSDLQDAADVVDADGVVEAAQAGVRKIREVDGQLEAIASDYQPARPLLVAWRRANKSLLKALGDIWNGAQDLDVKRIDRGSAELEKATGLLAETTPLIEEFGADTGFFCDGGLGVIGGDAVPTILPFGGLDVGPTPKPVRADVYYANCSEVRAAGAAPIRRGDPGYADHLDRDGDGIACEV